jgi:ABC-type branched-subunit amino acid transport system ATPase component
LFIGGISARLSADRQVAALLLATGVMRASFAEGEPESVLNDPNVLEAYLRAEI